MARQITRSVVVLVALAALSAGGAFAQQKGKRPMVTEPETGIELPVTLNVLSTKVGHRITGTAVREKTFLEIDVYACGHYVDADDARDALWKWKGKTAKQLAEDKRFRKKLLTPGFGRTLRLQLARDVDSEDFNDAFEESLTPRVEALIEKGVKGRKKDIATLKGFFTVDELEEGTKLDFTWTDDTLTVAMNVKQLGEIKSDALCRAMWDIYFGDDPIQDEFPQSLMERFPRILRTAQKPAESDDGKKTDK